MTGKFDNYTNTEKNERESFGGGMSASEIKTTEFLRSTPEGLRAARHPFKMLKISYIDRMATRTNFALLLSSVFPTPFPVALKMSATGGSPVDTVAVQLHWSTGSPVQAALDEPSKD
jgi:hypothetical protein